MRDPIHQIGAARRIRRHRQLEERLQQIEAKLDTDLPDALFFSLMVERERIEYALDRARVTT